MAIAHEYDTQLQIDRACAAQSPDMLPEEVKSGKDASEAQKKNRQIESKLQEFFSDE